MTVSSKRRRLGDPPEGSKRKAVQAMVTRELAHHD